MDAHVVVDRSRSLLTGLTRRTLLRRGAAAAGAVGIATVARRDAAAEVSASGHPLLGTWLVTPTEGGSTPYLIAATADGTAIGINPLDGSSGSFLAGPVVGGVWRPTAADTGLVTSVVLVAANGQLVGDRTYHGTAIVDATGNAFTGWYDWVSGGRTGPVDATGGPFAWSGTRIAVEPMAVKPPATPAPTDRQGGTPTA